MERELRATPHTYDAETRCAIVTLPTQVISEITGLGLPLSESVRAALEGITVSSALDHGTVYFGAIVIAAAASPSDGSPSS
jgi:hypothetical protein